VKQEIEDLSMNKPLLGQWKPTRKDQAHKHIVLHFFISMSEHPLCDKSSISSFLSPDRIATHCKECEKLYNNLSKGFLRKCKFCGLEAHTEEALDLFRPDKTMIYQRANQCKECLHKNGYAYSALNRDKIIKRIKERRKNNPGYYKSWKKDTHAAVHMMAHRHVEIKGNCQICGSSKSLLRHHPDYTKATFVIILCKSCHGKIHSKDQRPQ
jgi:uncharacterized protein (DUF983 family)